jgi:hypothetical protein
MGVGDGRPGRSLHPIVCATFEVIRDLAGDALEFVAQPDGKTSEGAEDFGCQKMHLNCSEATCAQLPRE